MKMNNDICSYMYQILTKWASNYTSKITTKDSSEVFIFCSVVCTAEKRLQRYLDLQLKYINISVGN